MGTEEIIFISSRLSLGALASFFAILLWSKTRDIAWMLMVVGTITAYAETVYSILQTFGITGTSNRGISLLSIILPNLPTVFYIAAFMVMVIRKSRLR